MTRRIVWLSLIALALVAAAMISVTTADKTRFRSSFLRILPPDAATLRGSIKLPARRLSIAGFSNQSVYIRRDNNLVVVSLDMRDTCLVSIEFTTDHEITVDSPYFYIQNNTRGEFNRGDILTWNLDSTPQKLPTFLAVQAISEKSAVLQTLDLKERKSVFIKSNLPGHRKDVLTAQADGIFSTDGFLAYSKSQKIVVYTYRYRNQFICMDTSLNVLRTSNTIDSTSIAKIEVSEIDGKIVMSKPPFIVNKGVSVDSENLFVHSNLIAQNESVEEMDKRSVIDVYNILDGSYRFSFHIHDQGDNEMQTFKVRETTLIVIFPNEIVRYDLNPEYLRN